MSETVLQIARHFEAPAEQVFDAWLSDAWGDWIGPHGIRGEITSLDPKVGGRYSIIMHQQGRSPLTVSGSYREIDRPHKLVFTWRWAHEDFDSLVTLEFRAVGAGTALTLRHEGFRTIEQCDDHRKGWTSSLENLVHILAKGL